MQKKILRLRRAARIVLLPSAEKNISQIRRPLPTTGGARQKRDSKQWGPWPAGPVRISGAQAPFWVTQLVFL